MKQKITQMLEGIIYKLSVKVFLKTTLYRHTEAIVGLENLPAEGPYILIANHQSFFDHFLTATVNRHVFQQKIYFLTRKESFETFHSRVWHNATGAIPIDREKPDMNSFRQIFKTLQDGNVVVIYPEGTRGSGESLAEFKLGAFKIASRMGVPIISAGILDSRQVMPKGSRWFKDTKAKIAYSQAIDAQTVKKMDVNDLIESCKNTINHLVYDENSPANDAIAKQKSTDFLTQKIDNQIEEILYEGLNKTHLNKLSNIQDLIQVAFVNDERNIEARISDARTLGLNLLVKNKLFFLLNFKQLQHKINRIFEIDKDHPFGHYIQGQYYMGLPSILGGNHKKALDSLEKAYSTAKNYQIDPSIFALTYAKALKLNDKKQDASTVINFIKQYPARADDLRLMRRKEKAQELLQSISF